MKKIVLLFIMLISAFGINAQNSNFEKQTDNWEFTEIILVDSTITKEQLFNSAMDWFAINFKSAKNVLEINDKEQGKLFGKGCFDIGGEFGYVYFTILIQCKNGKYKYLLSDFFQRNAIGHNGVKYHNGFFDYGSLKNTECESWWDTGHKKSDWIDIKNITKKEIWNTIQSLKNSMNKKTIQEKENW